MLCRISTETLGVDIRRADGVTSKHMMSGWTGLDLLPPTTNPGLQRCPMRRQASTVTVGALQGPRPCSPTLAPMGVVPLYLPAGLVVVKVHECPAGGGPLAPLPDVHKGLREGYAIGNVVRTS